MGVVDGVLLVVFLGLVIMCMKHKHKKQIEGMVRVAENNESLQMTTRGWLRVPAATRTRTNPSSLSFMTDSTSGGSLGVPWGTSSRG